MQRTPCAVLLAALWLCPTSCDSAEPPPRQVARSDAEVVLERSRRRWEHVEAGKWSVVREFHDPRVGGWEEVERDPLIADSNRYRVVEPPTWLGRDGSYAFVEVAVEWSPNPALAVQPVALQAGGAQPEPIRLEIVEAWARHEGEWGLVESNSRQEHRRMHPEWYAATGR